MYISSLRQLLQRFGSVLHEGDAAKIRERLRRAHAEGRLQRDAFGLDPVVRSLDTALLAADEIGLRRDGLVAVMLRPAAVEGDESVAADFGESVARIMHGLERIRQLYRKTPVVETENFRNLLLSFAEDMRVILIMIADRVSLMRSIRDAGDDALRREVSRESMFLYAPLAHKLGLYQLKSELEDLSLKYTEPEAYYHIREKLSETKASRDAYIGRFIGPIDERLREAGLSFHIKGRTKSIHSIWQKMKKQKCPFEGVYDLFAIRIILDSPPEKEKMQCRQTSFFETSMQQPNTTRLRD